MPAQMNAETSPSSLKHKPVHKAHHKKHTQNTPLSHSSLRKAIFSHITPRITPHLPPKIVQLVQKEALECPVCCEVMVRPVLTPCGHHYCLHCLEHLVNCAQPCAICRQVLEQDSPMESPLLQRLVEASKKRMNGEEIQQLEKREEHVREIEMKRNISADIEIGEYLQFRRGNGWKVGKVTEKSQYSLVVIAKYKNNVQKSYCFQYGSRNMAVLGCFTSFKPHRSFPKPSPIKEPLLRLIEDDELPARPVLRLGRGRVEVQGREEERGGWWEMGGAGRGVWEQLDAPDPGYEIWGHILDE